MWMALLCQVISMSSKDNVPYLTCTATHRRCKGCSSKEIDIVDRYMEKRSVSVGICFYVF